MAAPQPIYIALGSEFPVIPGTVPMDWKTRRCREGSERKKPCQFTGANYKRFGSQCTQRRRQLVARLDLVAKLFVELTYADIRGVIFSNSVSGLQAAQIIVATSRSCGFQDSGAFPFPERQNCHRRR